MAGNSNAIEVEESSSKRKPEVETSSDASIAKKSKPTLSINVVIEADVAEDKGARHTMEDAWVLLPNAIPDHNSSNLRCSHFAVYDGHGGRLAAEYAEKHLHSNVLSAGFSRELFDIKAAKKAILEGFRKTDEAILQESAAGTESGTAVIQSLAFFSAGGWHDGATAVCMWVLGQTVFVANIGDAKAVVGRFTNADSNESILLKAIVLTRDHKAIFPLERSRIRKAGGSVSSSGRLQGRLEVSRALGDRQFKKFGVIAVPDIQSFDITERDQFIILGCDGLWGVLGPKDAVDFVHNLLKDGLHVKDVCRKLVREAVRERGCKDNCTAVVVVFRRK